MCKITCLLFAFLVACSNATDIRKVGTNALEKKSLDGEWYFRTTLVDKQFGNDKIFIGTECDLDRVNFDITEKALNVYRSYEKVSGTQAGYNTQQHLLASFPIQKHFDVYRQYNPHTRVQNNVIEENDSDRRWWERKHMRVDWSVNLAPESQCNDWIRTQTMQQIARHEESPEKNPWRMIAQKDYLESTIEALASPDSAICKELGDWNCSPTQVRMKLSFMRVSPKSSYEPKSYPDYLPIKIGKNKAGEPCVTGQEGCEGLKDLWVAGGHECDPAKHPLGTCELAKIPVFEKFGFFRTAKYAYDRKKGFTFSDRDYLINRWNIWQNSKHENGQPIPLSERIPKPIIYHLNVGFPPELFDASQELADGWSKAISNAVAQLKAITIEEVEKLYGKLVQIRINSCNIANVTNYVREHSLSAKLAEYGISEIQQNNLEPICSVLEWISDFQWQRLGDLRYSFINWSVKAELAGPLGYGPSATDPLTGEIISANANIYGASIDTYAASGADIVAYMNGDLSKSDIINGSHIRRQVGYSKNAKVRQNPGFEKFLARFDSLLERPVSDFDFAREAERVRVIREEGFEKDYLHLADFDQLLSVIGHNSEHPHLMDFTEVDFSLAKNKYNSWHKENRREDFFGERSACFTGGALEPAIAELAQSLKGKPWEEIYQQIRKSVFIAVTAHEMGHTLGLRHNFEGSADALNFFPNYWGVDTHDHRLGKSNRKSELQYSSIMDYHQRINGDFGGVGLYDKAAILSGYADLVEVFDESQGSFVPTTWNESLGTFHYKDLPYLFAGGNANKEILNHFKKVKDAFRTDPKARLDVTTLPIKANASNLFKRRYITFDEFYKAVSKEKITEGKTIYEVPYKYCSDGYVSPGNFFCNRWDMGASAEEIIDNSIQMYEFYYPFTSFRGDKTKLDPQAYMSRLNSRTFVPMVVPFNYLYRFYNSQNRFLPAMNDWAAAAYKGLDFLVRVLQTVEPGQYCLDNKQYIKKLSDTCANEITIPIGQGRWLESKWTNETFYKPVNIGHIYDKLLAMMALTSQSAKVPRGTVAISYYSLFAPELIKLFSSLVKDDIWSYAPIATMGTNGVELTYRSLFDLSNTGNRIAIEPSHSMSVRTYALTLPMLRYSKPSDDQPNYAKLSRITEVGSTRDVVADSSVPQIVFEDPFSRNQYRAVAKEKEALSLGYQLLSEAQRVVDKNNGKPTAELKELVEMIEALRKLGDMLEYGG